MYGYERTSLRKRMKKENRQKARERREKERAAAAKRAKIEKIIMIAVPILVIALIAGGIVLWQNYKGKKEGVVDYGAFLTKEGMIKNVDIEDYVELYDYSELTIAKKDVEPSDSEIEEAIFTALSSYAELQKDSSLKIAEEDMVNIDYIGYIDGETFEGGSTNGAGTSLTVGSGMYIEGFEDGLIGAAPGDELTLNLKFPDNYQNASLKGKDVIFEVTVNGIYSVPELTDELVAEHFSEVADSAEAYKKHVTDSLYQNNLLNKVMEKVINGSTISEYPEKYYDNLYDIYAYEYAYNFQYANNQYYQATGSYRWNNPYEYYGVTETEYKEKIVETVDANAQYYLVAQAIHEKENLPVPAEEDIAAYIADMGYTEENKETVLDLYGEKYLVQYVMADQAFQHITEQVQVTE